MLMCEGQFNRKLLLLFVVVAIVRFSSFVRSFVRSFLWVALARRKCDLFIRLGYLFVNTNEM
jgi:hypothetical protein